MIHRNDHATFSTILQKTTDWGSRHAWLSHENRNKIALELHSLSLDCWPSLRDFCIISRQVQPRVKCYSRHSGREPWLDLHFWPDIKSTQSPQTAKRFWLMIDYIGYLLYTWAGTGRMQEKNRQTRSEWRKPHSSYWLLLANGRHISTIICLEL